MNNSIQPLFTTSEWNFDLINRATIECGIIAKEELKLNTYPNQIEIISSSQMIDAYTSIGLPVMYKHWSFGKRYSRELNNYQKGYSGLAYEIVINSNPVVSYLMEENTACTQVLVIAHACYGHNHFFKNNYLFKQWTDADSIIDYLVFAKNYITKCEEKYGEEAVELTLNAAHSLMNNGIDRYKRPKKLSLVEEKVRQKEREQYIESNVNNLWNSLIKPKENKQEESNSKFPKQSEENILYFLEKNSPTLQTWQREILRIVRKLAQYLHPQGLTKNLNEGWASFTHYYTMNKLYNKGLLTDGAMLEFTKLHTSVVFQPPYDSPYYSGLNPYYLGFELFNDIKRICTNPTNEDKELFSNIVNENWLDVCLDVVANYRDESAIRQFLSPTLVRKLKLFKLHDNKKDDTYQINAIQNREGFKEIRSTLADSYEVDERIPKIEIIDANIQTDRTLILMYNKDKGRSISENWKATLQHVRYLWGHKVKLITKAGNTIGEIN
jgi:spore cortex formation protein SpoVR/YcgB (stage V sporulation)